MALRTFFKWLKPTGQVKANLTQAVIPPIRREQNPKVLSASQRRMLLSATENPRDKAIILLFLITGIGLREMERLTTFDVQGSNRGRAVTDETVRLLTVHDRTGKWDVKLNSRACQALVNWFMVRQKGDSDALFLNIHHRPIKWRGYQHIVNRCLKQAGITKASIQTLRNTYQYGASY